MKEATGELNSAVIAIISVGVLMTFFFSFLWPAIKGNFAKESQCNKAKCDCSKEVRDEHDGKCWCTHPDVDGEFPCVFKG